MSKKSLLVLALAMLLAIPAAAQTYTAFLTGPAEVPNPGDPDGVGVALITIDDRTIRYSIVTQNIGTPTAAHIHTGPAGVPGGVVVGFNAATLANGVVENVALNVINAIKEDPGSFYVNVHNAEYPDGAIRGQLVPTGDSPSGPQYIPVVGKVTGAAGTNFVTDLRLINRGSTTEVVTLDFFRQSPTGGSTTRTTTTLAVAPGQQRDLNDIVGFMGSDGLGALRVSPSGSVEVLARVLNDLRSTNEGTTGFAVNATRFADARMSGTLGFLSTSSVEDINARTGFRTNIGYFNPTERTVTVTFTAHAPDGSVLGSRTVSVPPFGHAQQGAFQLIDTVPAAEQVQPSFYVTWNATGGPLLVYAAVVDNRTGDSVIVQ